MNEELLVTVSQKILDFWLHHENKCTNTELAQFQNDILSMDDIDEVEVEDVQVEVANQCLDRGFEYTEQLQQFIDNLF